MLRVNVFLYFFLLIPLEAQVQTKGASIEAKETECTKVISLSLAANSDSKVFFQQPYYSYHKQNTFFCFRPQQEDPKPIDEELMKILRVGNWLSNCRIMISDSTVVCLGGEKDQHVLSMAEVLVLNLYLFFSDSPSGCKKFTKYRRYLLPRDPTVRHCLRFRRNRPFQSDQNNAHSRACIVLS